MTAGSADRAVPAPGEHSAGRIEVLDVARGMAILGTLGTNVWVFTAPGGGPAGALLGGGTASALLRAPFNGVSLALLLLLFGVGLELQHAAARRRGRIRPPRYPLRCTLLALEGVVHYVLVFEYDVLLAYGLVAVLVSGTAGLAPRARRALVVLVAAAHVGLITLLTVVLTGDRRAAEAFTGPTLPGAGQVYTAGSWPDQVALRLAAWPVFRLELLVIVPLGIVLFAVGGLLVRRGLFDDAAEPARLRRRAMLLGLGAGLPATVGLALAGPAWFGVQRYVVGPVVALGLLAALTEMVLAGRGTRWSGPVAELGRTALSGYVLQNLVTSAICYGWGFGLTAWLAPLPDTSRALLVLALGAGVGALVLVAATAWRRRFSRGPIEALMHRALR